MAEIRLPSMLSVDPTEAPPPTLFKAVSDTVQRGSGQNDRHPLTANFVRGGHGPLALRRGAAALPGLRASGAAGAARPLAAVPGGWSPGPGPAPFRLSSAPPCPPPATVPPAPKVLSAPGLPMTVLSRLASDPGRPLAIADSFLLIGQGCCLRSTEGIPPPTNGYPDRDVATGVQTSGICPAWKHSKHWLRPRCFNSFRTASCSLRGTLPEQRRLLDRQTSRGGPIGPPPATRPVGGPPAFPSAAVGGAGPAPRCPRGAGGGLPRHGGAAAGGQPAAGQGGAGAMAGSAGAAGEGPAAAAGPGRAVALARSGAGD